MIEDEDILNNLYDLMKENNVWFTNKSDLVSDLGVKQIKLDEYGYPVDKEQSKIIKQIKNYIGDGAEDIQHAIQLWYDDSLQKGIITYIENIVTEYKPKPLDGTNNTVFEIDVSKMTKEQRKLAMSEPTTYMISRKGLIHENRNILKEANEQSSALISDMMQDENFDANSEDGKIVLRTSKLLNNLSKSNFNVQISFDNGESLTKVILTNPSAIITISITNSNDPLKVFTSGNYEITEDILKQLNTIRLIVKDI